MKHRMGALLATALFGLTLPCAGLPAAAATPQFMQNGAALPANPTLAASQATGPGTTDSRQCHVPYGVAPAAPAGLLSGNGAGLLGTLATVLLDQCSVAGGETLRWTDARHEARAACLITPPGASPRTPLPMLVYLQGSIAPAVPQLFTNGWLPLTRTANLNGDPAHPGFILLVPIGRNTHHFYPAPDDYGLGWDNWHRNLDRNSPDLNLDVAAIDQFIGQVQARGIVDANRLYMTGWSNGAAMAQLYALNTPAVAAAAVYSSPAPFSDVQDPCQQTPFATTLTPLMDIHNSCDIIGICQTGSRFHEVLAQQYPRLQQNPVIVNALKQPVAACDNSCSSQAVLSPSAPGAINHLIWPLSQNEAMFTWLRDHPLSQKP